MGNSKFKPGKAISIFVLFFFPLLILLGVWQVNRGIEKGDLLALYASNKSMHPMQEEDFFHLNISNNKYRNLFLSGEYLPKVFFLDNRTYRNKAGFEVFSLFQTKKNNIFIVLVEEFIKLFNLRLHGKSMIWRRRIKSPL